MEEISMKKKLSENKTKNSSNNNRVIGDDIAWEVLLRLPSKSLMRFKIVSKLWYSIICNPNFGKQYTLHGASFQGVLIGDNLYFEAPMGGPVSFFYASLFERNNNNNKAHNRCMDRRFIPKQIGLVGTEVVKGLIGLFSIYENTFSLCNIATHESLTIPNPNNYRPPPLTDPIFFPNNSILPYHYHLGFDPVEEVYKVLRLSMALDDDKEECINNSEIITLGGGGGGWRDLGLAPTIFETRSLWINDALYWLAPKCIDDDYPKCSQRSDLIAFHLNTETFQTIPVPDYVRQKFHWSGLAQIGGRPAIYIVYQGQPVCRMVELWTMDDDCMRGRKVAGEGCSWTKRIIDLPGTKPENIYIYAGMLPTGNMLLAETSEDGYPIPIYWYDHVNNQASLLITINEAHPSPRCLNDVVDWRSVQAWYYQENIIPLRFLICSPTTL